MPKVKCLPMRATGRASVRNSHSMETASLTISKIRSWLGFLWRCLKSRQAKSVCKPSSLEINSLLKVNPGMSPRFFNQKIAAKLPEKKIPSTEANAMILSANVAFLALIHLRAQSAFFLTAGIVSMALNNLSFSAESLN